MRRRALHQTITAAVVGLASVAAAVSALAQGPWAPARGAVLGEQPTKPWPSLVRGMACTATGTYTDEDGSGPGAFTRTAPAACHVHGDWTDTFGYTWLLHKTSEGKLAGTVHYHHIPGCTANIWPVTGKYHGAHFTVTATNPVSDTCSPFFTYILTIQ
jgi:hypothetical protein